MKNINTSSILAFNHKLYFDELLCYLEENPLTEAQKIAILTAYDEYYNKRNTLETITPIIFPPLFIADDKWEEMYSKLRYRIRTKWKQILGENFPVRCPSCGISTPSDAEHFLCRKKYKEYSFLLLNLIPWCSDCNRKKGVYIIDDKNTRLFLNCYWDEIDQYIFLHCKINVDQEKVSSRFYVTQPAGCPDYLYQIVENHMKKQDLNIRYIKIAKEEVKQILDSVEKYSNMFSLEQIKKIISDQKDSIISFKGRNSWSAAILSEFYNCLDEHFLGYIQSKKWQ